MLKPEWLVILKFIAGGFKYQEDAIFLLSRKGLVNRQLSKEKIINLYGRAAWGLAKHGYQRWFDIADGKAVLNPKLKRKDILILERIAKTISK